MPTKISGNPWKKWTIAVPSSNDAANNSIHIKYGELWHTSSPATIVVNPSATWPESITVAAFLRI